MLREDRIHLNRAIRDNFLDLTREIPLEYRSKDRKPETGPFGYIYCIENSVNDKLYIGSAYSLYTDIENPTKFAQLKKRANQYIYEYNKGLNLTAKEREVIRPIVKAMLDYGIDKFKMYPIAETSYNSHGYLEKVFINKFRAFTHGYNSNAGGKMQSAPYRKPISSAGKKLRSEPIICICLIDKKIVLADSMKLFADYIGTTKDMIKNVVRGCNSYKGWYIFYTNQEKREGIITDMMNNSGVFMHLPASDKRKQFFLDLNRNITQYLSDKDFEEYKDFTLMDELKYEEEF